MESITHHDSVTTKRKLTTELGGYLRRSGDKMSGSIEYQNISAGSWARGINGLDDLNAIKAGLGILGTDAVIDKVYMRYSSQPWVATSGPGIDITSTAVTITGDAVFKNNVTVEGTLLANISGSAASANSVPWSGVTGKPTTLTGYNITDAIPSSQKGAANGIAPLGADGKINKSYIPTTLDSLTVTATISGSVSGSSNYATSAGSVSWSGITGKPTTLSGYSISDAISKDEKGVANGVATLNESGKIPITQLDSSVTSNALPLSGGMMTGTIISNSVNVPLDSTNTAPIEVRNAGGDWAMMQFHCLNAYGVKLGLRPDGVFGMGGWSKGTGLAFYSDASNNFVSTGNVTAYSDARLKTNIKNIPNALNKVLELNGITFKRTDTLELGTGVIAQEVLKVLPEAVVVGKDENEYLTVAYGNLVGLLIEAIKELNAEVVELKKRVNDA